MVLKTTGTAHVTIKHLLVELSVLRQVGCNVTSAVEQSTMTSPASASATTCTVATAR